MFFPVLFEPLPTQFVGDILFTADDLKDFAIWYSDRHQMTLQQLARRMEWQHQHVLRIYTKTFLGRMLTCQVMQSFGEHGHLSPRSLAIIAYIVDEISPQLSKRTDFFHRLVKKTQTREILHQTLRLPSDVVDHIVTFIY